MLEGRNVYFFDDVETLRQEWSSINYETVGELCVRTHTATPADSLTQVDRFLPLFLA